MACIGYMPRLLKHGRQYESSPEAHIALYDQYSTTGLYGRDKRGVAVRFGREGVSDVQGLVRATSLEFVTAAESMELLTFWDLLATESLRAGRAFTCRVSVPDMEGASLTSVMQSIRHVERKLKHLPQGYASRRAPLYSPYV